MWKKIIVGFLLTVSLIFIGFYAELSWNLIEGYPGIFKDYPMIFVGLGAAIAALVGVVISQGWQTYNIKLQSAYARELKEQELAYNKNVLISEESEAIKKEFIINTIKIKNQCKLLVDSIHDRYYLAVLEKESIVEAKLDGENSIFVKENKEDVKKMSYDCYERYRETLIDFYNISSSFQYTLIKKGAEKYYQEYIELKKEMFKMKEKLSNKTYQSINKLNRIRTLPDLREERYSFIDEYNNDSLSFLNDTLNPFFDNIISEIYSSPSTENPTQTG
ncbi:hypothetical protein MMG00_12805 [Ignatzschineria rhizosphaerae]|uniref:Phage abortive infection protein n=1 Tax=Ignatzschineria rhizosphaerae TaxID=2923279 RepID=A0ABY3X5N7_9GAMM|nr:hypothetical protein [Ignatzschineria rhizosphaerae]UNM96061.1 hypothetical protein MMG00_12805 [Ignatzschineria rhizosphaerae]